jgi:hypothetical protein
MIIFEIVNRPSGTYGLSGTALLPEDLLRIRDKVNNWLKTQSGYNESVPQYLTHDGAGNFQWIDLSS